MTPMIPDLSRSQYYSERSKTDHINDSQADIGDFTLIPLLVSSEHISEVTRELSHKS
jgi:hypothetical protein